MNILNLKFDYLIAAFSTNRNIIGSFFLFLSYTKRISMSSAKKKKIADEKIFRMNKPTRKRKTVSLKVQNAASNHEENS